MEKEKIQLLLTKKWFEMTKSGEKTEDYRELTPYWCNRFLLFDGKQKTIKWWSFIQNYEDCFFRKAIEYNLENGKMTFRHFDINRMTLGYPKSDDMSKILDIEHAGIEIRNGYLKWGAEPGKFYFVIKHGKLLTIEK